MEASYHSLDEYMVHAAEWYDAYELTHPNVKRKIFLATDESAIIKEATTRYRYIYCFHISVAVCSNTGPKDFHSLDNLVNNYCITEKYFINREAF